MMNLTIYGSQQIKDKNKVPSFQNSTENDLNVKLKERTNSISSNNKGKLSSNMSLQITPLSTGRRNDEKNSFIKINDNESARTKFSTKSGSTKLSQNSNKISSNSAARSRKGNLETFLDLKQMSNDFPDKDGVEKWLKEQDLKDWDEISISSNKKSIKSATGSKLSHIIPINKHAFESQNYSHNFEDESISYVSESTLTPIVNSNRQGLENLQDDLVKKHFLKSDLENDELRQKSAKIIQTWYRRHLKRQKLAQAAMKRMLTNKQLEIKQQQSSLEQIESVRKGFSAGRKSSLPLKGYKINSQNKTEDLKVSKRLIDKAVAEDEVEKLKLENKIHSRPNSARTLSSRSKGSNSNQSVKQSKSSMTNKTQELRSNEHVIDDQKSVEIQLKTSSPSEEKSRSENDGKSTGRGSEITTIDDILSTIKELESVDCLTDRSSKFDVKSNQANKCRWSAITEDIDKLLKPEEFKSISNVQSNPFIDNQLTSKSLKMHNNNIGRQSQSEINLAPTKPTQSTISDAKMNSILQFLNASEVVDDISELDNRRFGDYPTKQWNVYDVKELEENTQTAVNEVSTKVMTMKLELEEKQRSVEMLQKALQQQRELTVRQVKETQKDMEKRMDMQKDEYESALQRNHTFIDQLISKNELLQDKCNKLVVEMKEKTQKYEEKIKNIQENNNVDLKKVEAKHLAAEKLRREKWETEKTKLIKEMTIKGMETEIAQLIANHKQELRKMKQYYENEIVQTGENSYEKYNRQVEELRKQLYKEKEEALQKENSIIKERFDQEMQRQIHILESQRKQLYQEISDERDRLNIMGNKQKAEIENLRKQLEYKEDKVGVSMKLEHQHKLEEIQIKFDAEVRELKTQTELEKQIWVETNNKKNEAWMLNKEQEIKNEMKKNRDSEIEKVILKLEDDNTQSKQEIESSFNKKLKRAKDKYEAEIKELELSERQTKDKYNQIRGEFLEMESEHESLKVMIRQKEKEIDEVKQLYEILNRERDHVSDIIRQEFADRLVATEEENRKLKREISELRAKLNLMQTNHNEELERIQLNHQSDITEVHNKVKEAIKRKEENMAELKSQYQNETSQWQQKLAAAEKRSNHLESLLEQQRKHLLNLK